MPIFSHANSKQLRVLEMLMGLNQHNESHSLMFQNAKCETSGLKRKYNH
jgi:hypothetical protein